MKLSLFSTIILVSLTLTSCNRDYEKINYGKDACSHCKMTIVDDRYASELVTDKGKVFKFDDLICMRDYIAAGESNTENLLFVDDYLRKHPDALNAKNAFYLKNDFFASPMRGNTAAFESESDARPFADSLGVSILTWDKL